MGALSAPKAPHLRLLPEAGSGRNVLPFDPSSVVQCQGFRCLGNSVELNVRNWQTQNLARKGQFRKAFRHLRPDHEQPFRLGMVTAYEMTEIMTPIDTCFAACDAGKGERLHALDYEEFMVRLGMVFALGQVEAILLEREKWKQFLNMTGTNVFPVMSADGRVRNVLARFSHGIWTLTDSRLGQGRGCNPGTRFFFRNVSPAFYPDSD